MKPENLEFIGLWEASGWTKAETSRRLELDRSAIGKFITGAISPSTQTLKLFKLILASEMPGALTSAVQLRETGEVEQSEWAQNLFNELRDLHVEDRERVLNAVKAFVVGLPKREPVQYTIPSSQKRETSYDPKKVPVVMPGPPPEHEPSLKIKEEVERRIAAAKDMIRSRHKTAAV